MSRNHSDYCIKTGIPVPKLSTLSDLTLHREKLDERYLSSAGPHNSAYRQREPVGHATDGSSREQLSASSTGRSSAIDAAGYPPCVGSRAAVSLRGCPARGRARAAFQSSAGWREISAQMS